MYTLNSIVTFKTAHFNNLVINEYKNGIFLLRLGLIITYKTSTEDYKNMKVAKNITETCHAKQKLLLLIKRK